MIEVPKLNLALQGFSSSQASLIETWLKEYEQLIDASDIRWRLSDRGHADALLKAQDMPTDSDAKSLTEHVLWPNAQTQYEESMDQSKERLFQALTDLNVSIQLQALKYVLGSLIVERHVAAEPMKGLWHLVSLGILIAIVDFDRLKVSLRSDAHFLELEDANWHRRSPHAVAPVDFEQVKFEQLMWNYALRTERDILPLRYSQRKISLRRYPRLPLSEMSEVQLLALTLLREESCTLAQLSRQLGIKHEQAVQLLAAFYYSGSLTTKKLSAWEMAYFRMMPRVVLNFVISQTTLGHAEESGYNGPPAIVLSHSSKMTS
jgi:hypothetical protein